MVLAGCEDRYGYVCLKPSNLQLKEWEKIKNLAEEKYSKLEKKCSEFDKK
jgi:hypothetical protein